MIKKLVSPYMAIIEQIADTTFTKAHVLLNRAEIAISNWTDNLWAGEEE